MKTDESGPAFPGGIAVGVAGDIYESGRGMSLRDWFAGQALSAAVEDYDRKTRGVNDTKDNVLPWACKGTGTREQIIARQAYLYADAMLAAREGGAT